MKLCSLIAAVLVAWCLGATASRADIFATGFFSDTIERFDDNTNAQSTFAFINGNPGLSGIAYNASNNLFYVSALNHGGVYMVDGTSGAVVNFAALGIGPGGLTIGPNGNVYVSDFTSNNVWVYDPAFANAPTSISVPVQGVTSGVGFAPNGGNLYIATAGGGVFQYDGNSTTPLTGDFGPSSQVISDGNSVIVGHGLGQLDSAFRYDLAGNLLNTYDITAAMMPGAPAGSTPGFSPSGVAFDADGNVIIAVLGRSNEGDLGGEFGGLFRFDINGNLLPGGTIAIGTFAFSGVAYVSSIPEPSSLWILGVVAATGLLVRRR